MFDRVLGGEDQEWARQLVCLVFDSHMPFGHSFKQTALRLGRRPVDFVSENDVGKYRSRLEFEIAAVLVEDRDTDDVRGEKIAGELNSLEAAIKRPRDGMGEGSFPDSGNVFYQEVSAREQGHDRQLDNLGFAANYGFDCLL